LICNIREGNFPLFEGEYFMNDRFVDHTWLYLLTLCLFSLTSTQPLIGQTKPSIRENAHPVQDAEALKVIERAVEAMGGKAAWSKTGAAMAQADISLGTLPSERIEWEDDWSTSHPKFRRSSVDQTKRSALIGDEHQRMLRLSDGRTKAIPAESNLAALALGYPGPALTIGLQRSDCLFIAHTSTQSDPDVRITEECPGSASSGPPVLLEWEFSKTTGFPTVLRRPVRDIIAGRRLWELVIYVSFQAIDGLSVPTELAVMKPNGAKESIRVSETRFSASLPEAIFNIQKDGSEK
jgi:hypothetical protein